MNRFRPRKIFWSLQIALALAVAPTVTADESAPAWMTWMKEVVPGLSKSEPPPAAGEDWIPALSRHKHRFRLPPGYQQHSPSSCWMKGSPGIAGHGYRNICIRRDDDPLHFWGFYLKPFRNDPRQTDPIQFEDWHADTVLFAGRRIVVERALKSGGIAGLRGVRSMVAFVELGGNELAIVDGTTGDDQGYQELLTIATTIEPPHLLSESEAVALAEEHVRKNGFVNPKDADSKWAEEEHTSHPESSVKKLISQRAHALLPHACGVQRKIRDGFQWAWHVVFCYDPRKRQLATGAESVVQVDLVGSDPFIPQFVPDKTSMQSQGIKRLPGMAEFERLVGASRPDGRSRAGRLSR